MDYSPAEHRQQGLQARRLLLETIGPYDMWAIEYGYKPLSGGTEGEVAELKKIASRCGRAGCWPTPRTRTPAASIRIRWPIASTWEAIRWSTPRHRTKLISDLMARRDRPA